MTDTSPPTPNRDNRRTIPCTCRTHVGAKGFCNLRVSKVDGAEIEATVRPARWVSTARRRSVPGGPAIGALQRAGADVRVDARTAAAVEKVR